ncbi:Holliday junction resolvase RuvX [Candidatus Desulforudis audaxviator]|uniref:Putative pre-16S rRNA nuclease n=1 Tax=Desulforudis audaxviator (strain MP104C) TaxID=477974 RepID=YQGF_DESAP|nr:Holliday junction resolvase RuvX [Candidatus Desulforudis audaxviator]B1I373.1 RecName: Full=Putative pre-16S rRNA nuclease [Candidatus Desulforudis audaxviator MP104C]ACA59428.1 Holliday junction resolvase YqgF [Candidatus Desulforudis audaxviator MP104C]AZK59410.1 Holliday junction resolvase YggF [Candidatus Desulforudis audaxviator]
MRLMGLDIGDRRIGVALTDENGVAAYPLEVLERTSPEKDLRRITEIIDQYGVERVVAGLPKTLSGQIGPQGDKVLSFLDKLRVRSTVPVITWDERLTTAEVEKLLVSADLGRRRRRKVVDKLAATLILNSYLNSRKSGRNT